MYHVELREFPDNTHAYNLDVSRLRTTILDPFARGEAFQLGGREWVPQRTKLTILEGAQLPLQALEAGRGWNNARRTCRDVTAELLATLDPSPPTTTPASAPPATPGREDAVMRDILARTAMAPLSLAAIWDRAEIAAPDASSGEWLILAQAAVTKLLADNRITLRQGDEPDAPPIDPATAAELLRTREAWATDRASALYVHAT